MPENYDVVIAGAGMAGGILAARIAERGVNPRTGEKLRVALMDMGPYFKGDPRPGYGIPLRRQSYANLPGRDDIEPYRSTPWGLTAGIGGRSLHWNGVSQLPVEEDYEQWLSETGVDWSYEKLTDARMEITEMFHRIPVPEEILPPGSLMFRDAATKMGYKVRRSVVARLNCICCSLHVLHGCKYDAKSGSLNRYIPIAERNGVKIMPDTTVEKVILEKRGATAVATGVVFTQAGKTQEARAEKVILSCSTSGNPLLLYKSGYGPKEMVQGELLVENPNVGRNVDANLGGGGAVWAVFEEPVARSDFYDWGAGVYFVERGPQGRLNLQVSPGFAIGGSPNRKALLRLPPELGREHSAPEFGREHKEFMKRQDSFVGNISSSVNRQTLLRGELNSSGRVTLNLGDHPAIVKRAQEGREIAREILLKMGAKRVSDITKPTRFTRRDFTALATSSCRAGSDRSNSVVNSDFESHDIENLFICDMSVLPSVPTGGNNGATTAFLACHAWRRIVAKHFSRA